MCLYVWNKWTCREAILCSNWNKMAGGEAGNVISKLCAGQVRQNSWSRDRCNILSTDVMAKGKFFLVVTMVEVDNVRWGGVDSLPFWSLVSSSEATTSDMPIFWVWAMRNQWLWAHLSPSMLWESRKRSIKCQSSPNFLTDWVPDAALIGRMAEKGDGIATMDGG